MSFTLSYIQGSFSRSEVFSSRLGAMAQAYIVLDGTGCTNLRIDQHGLVVANQAEIICECGHAKKSLRPGRPPERAH